MTCIHDKLQNYRVKMADIWNILKHGNLFVIKNIIFDVAYKNKNKKKIK